MKDGPETGDGGALRTNGDAAAVRTPDSDNSNGATNGVGGAGGDKKNGAGDRSFTCRVCNRCFGYKHVLQNHERTHTGEKPFECPECGKRFTRDHHLKTHLRLHTGEKPYQCPHCERHFVQVANLRRHLRVHTGERPYACTAGGCEARFSDSNQLKAHTLIHRGEKPYQCAECLGRFRRRHHLIHHRCPKDGSGRPRRGRRPKELHQLPPSDHEEEEEDLLEDPEELLHTSEGEDNHLDTSNSSPEPEPLIAPTPVIVHPIVHNGLHPVANGLNGNGLVGLNGLNGSNGLNGANGLNGTNGLNGANGDHATTVVVSTNGGRRKPSRTIRILTPQQREIFLRDKVSMQTQALDMSLSQNGTVTVLEDVHFLEDGVLDLSSSRSDSEADLVVVEPVRPACPCSLEAHLARRRPLSQRIANQRTNGPSLVHPGSGSEDSSDGHHHHRHPLASNGHNSEEENSVGPIPLTAKPKQHVSSSA